MNGRLTTHALDLSKGLPAKELKIELWHLGSENNRNLVKTVYTNHDGRVETPLLEGEDLKIGEYELLFYVGDYFQTKNLEILEKPFLDLVPIRFGINDNKAHYHIPLLMAPGGYSTYRGS
ncbi:hydroxyisourate hydrolase [Metabacillus herbersteinensis]|uniref:5-hydroxyisourate hydrolase n=1 Tax=Metabacillus herbersteinensis TaxID=283816 RepID=A0ABV6GG51_9BACI